MVAASRIWSSEAGPRTMARRPKCQWNITRRSHPFSRHFRTFQPLNHRLRRHRRPCRTLLHLRHPVWPRHQSRASPRPQPRQEHRVCFPRQNQLCLRFLYRRRPRVWSRRQARRQCRRHLLRCFLRSPQVLNPRCGQHPKGACCSMVDDKRILLHADLTRAPF